MNGTNDCNFSEQLTDPEEEKNIYWVQLQWLAKSVVQGKCGNFLQAHIALNNNLSKLKKLVRFNGSQKLSLL